MSEITSMKKIGQYNLDIEDGNYTNLIYGKVIEVKNGEMRLATSPVIIKY
ncbi:hypothetical protein [Clostridium sp. DJ247]|nr:hypothetical protein [Clostridium sp. DJ247]MBC2579518.1 hypothetical protein [Clostridium sp. DJ247]